MKKRIFIAAAVIISQAALAQELKSDTLKTLDEVIVTPNKFLQKQSETGKVVEVINRETIEKNYGKSLGELLNQQTGLVINGADNTPGTNQTIYLRGASSANTLILINGMPLYDASGITSEFDLNNFSSDNIERIEILKGAQSTLYGSDAVAGVINIITRKGQGNFNVSLDGAAGSYGTVKGHIAISGSSNGQTYYAGYSRFHSDGISAAYDSIGKGGFDKDGLDQDMLEMSYGLNKIKDLQLNVFAKYNNNKAEIDAGPFADDKDFTYHNQNLVAGTSARLQLHQTTLQANYSYNLFNRRFLDDSSDVGGYSNYQKGDYRGRSHFAELYATIPLREGLEILAGGDFRFNKTQQEYIYLPDFGYPAVPISGDSVHTTQESFYASLYFKKEVGFNLEAGGRINFHNIYGTNATYTFNPFWLLHDHWKVYANLSSGYRVPSLYQLYSEYGNKGLRPETTTSYEGGVQWMNEKINVRLTGFARNGKNIFVFYFDPNTFISQYINGDKQRDYGFETETRFMLGQKVMLNLNYTFADGKVTTSDAGKDTSYFNLYKRPRHNANLVLSVQPVDKLYFSAHLKGVSSSYEPQYLSEPYKLKGYLKLDLLSRYSFSNKFSLFADLQNVTGTKYFVTRGFTTRGFNAMAGLQLKM